MFLSVLTLLAACGDEPEHMDWPPPAQPGLVDSGAADTSPPESYAGPSYQACVSAAQCDAGSDCTHVPGFAGTYCSPPCDAAGGGLECALNGTLDFDTVCLEHGRCARTCGDPDSCEASLECQHYESEALDLCAGEPFGAAGFYGVCTHPNVDGADCPEESSCFGGDYIGIDDGICLPWCDDSTCPTPPDDSSATSPLCYDIGYEHPLCVLLCVPDSSVCPSGQDCLDLGGFGLCVPPGATSPI